MFRYSRFISVIHTGVNIAEIRYNIADTITIFLQYCENIIMQCCIRSIVQTLQQYSGATITSTIMYLTSRGFYSVFLLTGYARISFGPLMIWKNCCYVSCLVRPTILASLVTRPRATALCCVKNVLMCSYASTNLYIRHNRCSPLCCNDSRRHCPELCPKRCPRVTTGALARHTNPHAGRARARAESRSDTKYISCFFSYVTDSM